MIYGDLQKTSVNSKPLPIIYNKASGQGYNFYGYWVLKGKTAVKGTRVNLPSFLSILVWHVTQWFGDTLFQSNCFGLIVFEIISLNRMKLKYGPFAKHRQKIHKFKETSVLN